MTTMKVSVDCDKQEAVFEMTDIILQEPPNKDQFRSCIVTQAFLTMMLFRSRDDGKTVLTSEPDDVSIEHVCQHPFLPRCCVMLLRSPSYEPYEGDVVPCIVPQYYVLEHKDLVSDWKKNNPLLRYNQ